VKRALALVICCCALTAACAQNSSAPAATINGVEVTTQDVVDELEAISANKEYLNAIQADFQQQGEAVIGATPGTYDAAFVAAVVRRQMQFALMHEEVRKRGLEATDECKLAAKNDLILSLGRSDAARGEALFASFPTEYQNRLQGWYEDEFALQSDLAHQPCGNADVAKAYFDAHPEDFTKACVSIIGVGDEATANSIVMQVRGGADFAELARQFSTDAATASTGGDAGCHLPAEFPATIAPLVQATAPGAITDAISDTAGGFVIIKVNGRQPAAFNDVAAQADELAGRAQAVEFGNWLQQAQAAAQVTIDPRYGTFDPATFTIKPPPLDTNPPASDAATVPSTTSP
jgi:parvulin-like peptidyl-prolyl isomerase